MTRRRADQLGWCLIAAVIALSFALHHFRLLHGSFNWFMVILIAVAVGLVGTIAHLSRISSAGETASSAIEGAEDREHE